MRSLLILAALLVLAACQQGPSVICNDPYILVGDSCCLDKDGDGACDKDVATAECPELDCTKCPAQVIERNVTTVETKYICQKTGELVQTIEECRGENLAAQYTPITTNEVGTPIELFTLRPACRDGFNAVEIHYVLTEKPDAVTFEAKASPEAEWELLFTEEDDATEEYLYGALCENACTALVSFFLDPDAAYLLRARFDFSSSLSRTFSSNEYVIDATEESDYRTKLC